MKKKIGKFLKYPKFFLPLFLLFAVLISLSVLVVAENKGSVDTLRLSDGTNDCTKDGCDLDQEIDSFSSKRYLTLLGGDACTYYPYTLDYNPDILNSCQLVDSNGEVVKVLRNIRKNPKSPARMIEELFFVEKPNTDILLGNKQDQLQYLIYRTVDDSLKCSFDLFAIDTETFGIEKVEDSSLCDGLDASSCNEYYGIAMHLPDCFVDKNEYLASEVD
jgi:hypothetical protein